MLFYKFIKQGGWDKFNKREGNLNGNGIRKLLVMLFVLAFFQMAENKATSNEKKHPVIVNPKNPQLDNKKPRLCVEKAFTKEILFSEPKEDVQVTIDSKGNIYVVDSKSAIIKFFDKNGVLIRYFGKKGKEREEIIFPVNLLITPQNEILIKDKAKFCLYLFSSQGKLLKKIPYSIPNLGKIRINSKGNIIADCFNYEGSEALFEICEYDKELNLIKTLGSWDVSETLNKKELLYFGRYIDWELMRDDRLVVGRSDKYIFYICSPDGNIIREFRKEFEPIKISPEEREKELDRASPSAKERLKNMVYHKAFQYFTIDNENRIIVKTWEKTLDNKNYYYDVFNPEGVYISRFEGNFYIKKWLNGEFLAVEALPDGRSILKKYKVIWN